jgi:hypothetical protein
MGNNKKTIPAPTPQVVLDSLKGALDAVRELSAARLEAKLSVSRLTGVARELKELIRVISVYGC